MNSFEYKTLGKCCPLFDPGKWDTKTFDWKHKHFIKSSIPTFFHIPFPPMIGNKINKMIKLAEKADALAEERTDSLLLFSDPGPFRSDMYLSVEKRVPAAKNVDISGHFASRVVQGKYNATPKSMKEMDRDLAGQGKKALNYYVHYAYCPKCAKEAGHNYIVLFAELEE